MKKINNKAVSEVVSYVLLIVIAVGISVFVYSYLKVLIPKQSPECENEIRIVIVNYTCDISSKKIGLTLSNKGFFTIDAAYIRVSNSSDRIGEWINNGSDFKIGAYFQGLKPDETYFKIYNSNLISNVGNYNIEIEPAVYVKNSPIACSNSILKDQIICN